MKHGLKEYMKLKKKIFDRARRRLKEIINKEPVYSKGSLKKRKKSKKKRTRHRRTKRR